MLKNKYNVGNYALSLVSAGQPGEPGSPVVVLETGLVEEASAWSAVQEKLSLDYLTIRYDRAGRGESDPASKPRSALQMVEDLRRLLQAAGIEAPLILVGHSFGGMIVRLYAGLYPEQVVGLVLVDPTQEGQFEKVAAVLPPPSAQDSKNLIGFRQFWSQDYRFPERNREGIDFLLSEAQVAPYQSVGDLPVVILSGDKLLPALADQLDAAEKLRQMWWNMRQDLTRISRKARHSVVRDSGHSIQVDQPDAVVEAVLSIARAG